ncbi:MAG: ImmA/IrrE family metallo-endopeptidase [Cyanobacteria bacterium J06621_8]
MDVIKPYKFISKVGLETVATELRSEVESSRRRRRLSADSVATGIADYLELNVEWQSIPGDQQGNIAAMIIPVEKHIYINEDIPALREEFGQSTIAHEIGHWMLHIDHKAVGEYVERYDHDFEKRVTPQPFLCRSTQSLQAREWQAQYFAGCLLMPYHKLIEAKRGRDVTNWSHLYAMKQDFGVTISNLIVRLQSLGWIRLIDGSKQIYRGECLPKS